MGDEYRTDAYQDHPEPDEPQQVNDPTSAVDVGIAAMTLVQETEEI